MISPRGEIHPGLRSPLSMVKAFVVVTCKGEVKFRPGVNFPFLALGRNFNPG